MNSNAPGKKPLSVYVGAARYEQISQLAQGANRSVSNFVQHALWFYEAAKRHLPPEQFLSLDQGRGLTTEEVEKKA